MYGVSRVHTAAALLLISIPYFGSAVDLDTLFSKRGRRIAQRFPEDTDTNSSIAHAPLDYNVTTLTPQFFPEHHSVRVKISHGPYTVPPMMVDNGMKNFNEKSLHLPCTDCLITWMQAGLEYPDGTTANADTGMWLHHTVLSNSMRESVVCPSMKYGDRFFASGNERTPINICASG